MISFDHNVRELEDFINGQLTLLGQGFTVRLNLSPRSKTIIYHQAQNGRDATEAIGDIEGNEIEQMFSEPMNETVSPFMAAGWRRVMAENMGKTLRKFLVAGIHDEDLIDTGELLQDAQNCDVIIEGV